MTLWTPKPDNHDSPCNRPCCGRFRGNVGGHDVLWDLNSIMDFDLVVRVLPDGSVEDNVPSVSGPHSVYNEVDDDGSCTPDSDADMVDNIRTEGWEVLQGHSGQYGYSGPVMHESEYIGGGLAAAILEEPGLYVACAVYPIGGPEDDQESFGWIVAYREEA